MVDPAEQPAEQTTARRSRLGVTAAACVVFVAAMVGMSFAASPLYRIFCQATGYGGATRQADQAPGRELDRVITIRFDANIANGLGWSFRPMRREVKLKVGEVGEALFSAVNRTTAASTGTAVFNVAPGEAGAYFNKIACFCFSEQKLGPGESVDMPVTFFVDPAIVENEELDHLDTITLSYTFYPAESGASAKPLAAAQPVNQNKPL